MTFVPHTEILRIEEIQRLCAILVANGVTKIRLTGGEPLVRKGLVSLCESVAALPGLKELVLSTNGARLRQFATPLHQAGVKRLNISLDTLNPGQFQRITRTGHLHDVLDGIAAARDAGFQRLKLNAVIMKGSNDHEILPLLDYAIRHDLDISFIEEMPIGDVHRSRVDSFISSAHIRSVIENEYGLLDSVESSGGPSRYCRLIAHPGIRVGFISPKSQHFCASCNRVRITAEGRLLLCLGHEHSIDLRHLLRSPGIDDAALETAMRTALQHKPWAHSFGLDDEVSLVRFMNHTGG